MVSQKKQKKEHKYSLSSQLLLYSAIAGLTVFGGIETYKTITEGPRIYSVIEPFYTHYLENKLEGERDFLYNDMYNFYSNYSSSLFQEGDDTLASKFKDTEYTLAINFILDDELNSVFENYSFSKNQESVLKSNVEDYLLSVSLENNFSNSNIGSREIGIIPLSYEFAQDIGMKVYPIMNEFYNYFKEKYPDGNISLETYRAEADHYSSMIQGDPKFKNDDRFDPKEVFVHYGTALLEKYAEVYDKFGVTDIRFPLLMLHYPDIDVMGKMERYNSPVYESYEAEFFIKNSSNGDEVTNNRSYYYKAQAQLDAFRDVILTPYKNRNQ